MAAGVREADVLDGGELVTHDPQERVEEEDHEANAEPRRPP